MVTFVLYFNTPVKMAPSRWPGEEILQIFFFVNNICAIFQTLLIFQT